MHPITEVGTNVSAFLAKLWRMVEDPETNDLICWNTDGTSFMIKNQSQFAKELLPMYYKHNNMASFIRQLNMYGFHKVVSAESNGLRMTDNDEISFSHHCFIRGHPYLLEHIKRKMTVTKENNEVRAAPDVMNKMLNDVKSMKGRQESLDSKLCSMKQENEALWRELSILRQKHAKQQTIVNKLIQFLVTLVHPTRNLSVKRRSNFPLMLKEKAHYPHNGHKHSYPSDFKKRHYNTAGSDSTNPSPTGPTIHELDPSDFLETVQIYENNKRSASLRSDSPLSPTITDCDSGDEDILVDSPSIITSKLRNNLDDGTLLDLVTEVASPTEELMTVSPEEVSPVLRGANKNILLNTTNSSRSASSGNSMNTANLLNSRRGVKNITVNKALEEKKYKPLTYKRAADQKVTKRRGGRAKKPTASPVADSSLKSILTRTKAKMPQQAQKSGLKVKMPVRSVSSEINSNKQQQLIPTQSVNSPQSMGNGTGSVSAVSPLNSQNIVQNSPNPHEVLLVTDDCRIKEDGLVSPIVSTPLSVDMSERSPVGIVTMPSPVNGELQQIFDQSPLNDSILGMPDTFFSISDNPAAGSGNSVNNQTVISMSPEEILNEAPSTSPVDPSINDMALALSSPAQMAVNGNDYNALNRSGYSNDFSNHVEHMQNDLDCLKDLLQKEGLSLDANVLLGLFNSEDSMNFNPPAYQNPINQSDQSDISQSYNQLTTYNPSNLDLADVLNNSDWNVPISEETNNEDELFENLNTPVVSIPNSPLNTPLPVSSSSRKRKK